jgi:hypothetical protein
MMSAPVTFGARTSAGHLDVLVPGPILQNRAGSEQLPRRLSDAQFWQLVADLSEADQSFPSDNLVSNERFYKDVLPRLTANEPDSAYIGVGPEQNFSYVVAAKPVIAFIVDIRRRNRNLHLMYKALFELSTGRADFLTRLFSRPLPALGLARDVSVEALFARMAGTAYDQNRFERNYTLIVEHLRHTHGFALRSEDLEDIRFIFAQFARYGPSLTYWTGQRGMAAQAADAPTYNELMVTGRGAGNRESYLANEANFAAVKDLQTRNLIVPVIGDLAGSRAMPMIASWLTGRNARVSIIYVSNIEQYLRSQEEWGAFCSNIERLPVNPHSQVIRSYGGALVGGGALTQQVRPLTSAFPACQSRRTDRIPKGF